MGKRAKRALPKFIDRTTKSGSKTKKTTKKRTGGVKGIRPGDNFSPESVLTGRKKKQ